MWPASPACFNLQFTVKSLISELNCSIGVGAVIKSPRNEREYLSVSKRVHTKKPHFMAQIGITGRKYFK